DRPRGGRRGRGVVGAGGRGPAPPLPPAAAPAPAETLQARNLRIMRADIVPRLRDIVQTFYPPDNPIQVAGVRAFGSGVEVEFRATHPPPPVTGLAARLRGRYCTFRRRLVVHRQPAGEDRWYWMNPEKPFVLRVPVPF